MKTLNVNFIPKLLDNKYDKYPEGSISKREVISNIIIHKDHEQIAQKINAEISTLILSRIFTSKKSVNKLGYVNPVELEQNKKDLEQLTTDIFDKVSELTQPKKD